MTNNTEANVIDIDSIRAAVERHPQYPWPRVIEGRVVLARFRGYFVDEERGEFRRAAFFGVEHVPFASAEGAPLYREFRCLQLSLEFPCAEVFNGARALAMRASVQELPAVGACEVSA